MSHLAVLRPDHWKASIEQLRSERAMQGLLRKVRSGYAVLGSAAHVAAGWRGRCGSRGGGVAGTYCRGEGEVRESECVGRQRV